MVNEWCKKLDFLRLKHILHIYYHSLKLGNCQLKTGPFNGGWFMKSQNGQHHVWKQSNQDLKAWERWKI